MIDVSRYNWSDYEGAAKAFELFNSGLEPDHTLSVFPVREMQREMERLQFPSKLANDAHLPCNAIYYDLQRITTDEGVFYYIHFYDGDDSRIVDRYVGMLKRYEGILK